MQVVQLYDWEKFKIWQWKLLDFLTVRKTASTASLKAATTFVFFSLNFSKSGVIIMEEYCVNFLRRPVANWPVHLAARATTITFASLVMIWIKNDQKKWGGPLLQDFYIKQLQPHSMNIDDQGAISDKGENKQNWFSRLNNYHWELLSFV